MPQYDFTFESQALGGHNTWSNLARLGTGADLFVLDTANDGGDIDNYALEALVRRLWAADPSTGIVIMSSPSWNAQDTSNNALVDTPSNATMLADVEALADHYGIPFVDYWRWMTTVVPGTYNLTDLVADTVHPTQTGYNQMAVMLEAYLPNGGARQPATMPSRLRAGSADYENTPTRKNGTDYDSRTGTWADDGTSTSSSEVGATITFSATCQSIGCYVAAGVTTPTVEMSVDGGDYADASFYQNGIVIGERAAHTITVRVKSGTVTIDEFWAI